MTAIETYTVDIIIAGRERAKRYLKQYGAIQCSIMKLEQKYDNLDSQRFRWNQRYDTCGGSSSEKRDLGDIVAGFDEMMADAKKRMAKLRGFQEDMEAVVAHVQMLNPDAANALRERYFAIGKLPEWDDIATDLHYSEAAVRSHHVKALDIVASILEERNFDAELKRYLTSRSC